MPGRDGWRGEENLHKGEVALSERHVESHVSTALRNKRIRQGVWC